MAFGKKDESDGVERLLAALVVEVQGLRDDLFRAATLGGTVAKVGPRGLEEGAIRALTTTSNRFADIAKDVR